MTWDMLGHEWAVEFLREQIARGAQRHAYLIAGPEGVGRRTLALRLAQALNCSTPLAPAVPCQTCRSCRQFEEMRQPDLTVVQASQTGGILKVDQVRELQYRLALAPYESRYRIALLLRFEEANASAANALLKTLEEPPPQVVLVLTAESAERLMPTIVSRCEVLRLRPLPVQTLRQALEARRGFPKEKALLLAHISGGRPGYALRLQQEPERLSQRQGWLDDQARLLGASRVERFAYAEYLAKDKTSLRASLITWLSFWRDVMLQAGGSAAPLTNPDRLAEVRRVVDQLNLVSAHQAVSAIETTLIQLEKNTNARLALEVLFLDLPRV
jgi:DNA polymerase-3 subunit delta'